MKDFDAAINKKVSPQIILHAVVPKPKLDFNG